MDYIQKNRGGVYFVIKLKENAKETLVRELDLSDSELYKVSRDAKISLNDDSEDGEKNLE